MKRLFLDEWVKAVNEHGGFGVWAWDVSKNPGDIKDLLAKHAPTHRGGCSDVVEDPLGITRGFLQNLHRNLHSFTLSENKVNKINHFQLP